MDRSAAGTIDSRNGNGVTTNPNPTGPITWSNTPHRHNESAIAVNPVSVNRYGMQSYSWDLTAAIQQLVPAVSTATPNTVNAIGAGSD